MSARSEIPIRARICSLVKRVRHVRHASCLILLGFDGARGGILTNIVMTLSGLPMHKSIGRAAAAGVVVSVPATLAAALASKGNHPMELGSIDVTMWACIAPAQPAAAWLGARLAPVVSAEVLSRVFATALLATGVTMLHSSLAREAEKTCFRAIDANVMIRLF